MNEPTISYHTENLRASTSYYDIIKMFGAGDYRPAANLSKIVQLARLKEPIDVENIETTSQQDETGKKRTRSPSTESISRPNKRIKTDQGTFRRDNPCPTSMDYPLDLDSFDLHPQDDTKRVHAFRHVLELDYTSQVPQNAVAHDFSELDAWKNEEDWFRNELSEISAGSSEPLSIDLGEVSFSKYYKRYVAISPTGEWLVLAPIWNPGELERESYDFTSLGSLDLVHCLKTLALHGKMEIDSRLKLVIIPGKDQPSFRLHIELSASFITPAIFEPAAIKMAKTKKIQLEEAQRRILLFLFPPSSPPPSFEGAVNIPFYYSVLGPAPFLTSTVAEETMQPHRLESTLLPFQRRSVGWLLDREGMTVSEKGKIIPKDKTSGFTFWQPINVNGEEWFVHHLSGAIRPDSPPSEVPFGGILAEEPGLGKTIETISLILLNAAPPKFNPSLTRWDPEANLEVKAIKSTLIVTPNTLATQWSDELKAHAPGLKVLVYEGWDTIKVPINANQVEEILEKRKQAKLRANKKAARATTKAEAQANINKGRGKGKAAAIDVDDEEEEIVDWCHYVHSFDVVITTYNVLQGDLNVARAPPKRPRRDGVVYINIERPRSPLVMVEWARVVMDEVQMAGGVKTEDMVSLIPRRSSLAVSGTPARAQASDLAHVLKFLRFDIGSTRLWNRLLRPGFAGEFSNLFKYYSVRTMKSQVSHELTIPQQTRYLVSIDLGRVERLVYDQSLEAILNDLGLDARGVAASEGWDVDGALLRSSIRRLRGICTHPQVGQLVGQNERLYKLGALKTMADVLQNMTDQNWRNLLDDWRAKIQAMIRTAQLKQLDSQSINRFQAVLTILLEVEKEAEKMISQIEKAIAEHDIKGEALKREAAEQRTSGNHGKDGKGKGKRREGSPTSEDEDLDDDEEEEDGDLPKTPAGKEHRDKRSALKHRLREARIQYHRVKFLQGDVYHNLGEKYSAQENEAYATAEATRRDILKTTEQEAQNGMAQLKLDIIGGKSGISKEDLLIPVPFLEQGGIRSAEMIEELHQIIENVLNEQTELLWQWRSKIHSLLTQSLNPGGDDDADGQEYQRTLDNQGEAETFLQAYAALLADRREALTSERTILAAHDARETKQRKTKAALKAAAAAAAVDKLDIPADVEIQPQHEVLYKQLSESHKSLLTELNGRAVKSVLVDLTGALARTPQNDIERPLLISAVAELRQLIGIQQTAMDKVTADLALFRKAFNQRVLYFRQLQEISDSVAGVDFEGTREDALENSEDEIKDLEANMTAKRAHQRYLAHLVKSNEDDEMEEDDKCCILCRCDFERGFITNCAHIFCEGCLKEWMGKKDGKNCPVCRVVIDVENLQRFKLFEPQQPVASNSTVNGELVPTSHRKIDYNMIDSTVFETILSMQAIGDFGSKIQTLVRHILYLEQADPGSKSIVFSAWADSLTIVERALRENGLRSIRIDRGTKGKGPAEKFKSDPEISILLLHGERENAGLNVTCASRVFLLESVVHHGFEIQAIARIDRMGQTRPTEVYCYYAEDTVERNILDLAARQGLSLYTKANSVGSLNVSSFANEKQKIDSPSKKNSKAAKGDFISKIEDMLACLFPHMFEELEYLLPPEDVVMSDVTNTILLGQTSGQGKGKAAQENAVAGPSRLRR